MIQTNRSINLSAAVTIGGKVVAHLSANIANNGLNYNNGANIIDKETIEATQENKAEYEADKVAFEALVQAELV